MRQRGTPNLSNTSLITVWAHSTAVAHLNANTSTHRVHTSSTINIRRLPFLIFGIVPKRYKANTLKWRLISASYPARTSLGPCEGMSTTANRTSHSACSLQSTTRGHNSHEPSERLMVRLDYHLKALYVFPKLRIKFLNQLDVCRKFFTCFIFRGGDMVLMPDVFLGSIWNPPGTCPINLTEFRENTLLLRLTGPILLNCNEPREQVKAVFSLSSEVVLTCQYLDGRSSVVTYLLDFVVLRYGEYFRFLEVDTYRASLLRSSSDYPHMNGKYCPSWHEYYIR
ncbi:hypothetical protein EVAR_75264_1 [Eumeta japonica]|uniref:Uncharacterized protein n=1 Tax=Eumeta variegata TaxID=151549 RepID=A0A4C1V865_EUMVA|nr:hypothetical protein EVAR_75264_1 [Eumeta japonica]